VRLGEVEIGQHLGFAVVDERRELRPFLPQLVGNVSQRLARRGPIGLQKGVKAAATMLCWVLGT
jgi:hypothetical protein